MSTVRKYEEEKERGYLEILDLISQSLGRELEEHEEKLIESIYKFSFDHGVRTGTDILSETVQNMGKDDHES